jgi:dTDP-4-amino-4,6-dideoxygalactose transaminase
MFIPNILNRKTPLFQEPIYVTRPNLPSIEELTPPITHMLQTRWVTNFGDYHNELQTKLQEQVKVKHVLLCSNGTIALFLLLRALELKGTVLTTAFTFPATIHAIYLSGLRPQFCDIDPRTYTIDPQSVENNISPDVSGILGVPLFGNTCDITALEKISSKYGIPLIFDSAHAFCSQYNGEPVGRFGKAEMFSFHATKFFTTIEGGAIATNDTQLYKRLRNLINFGIADEEHVAAVGLNGKLSEMQAIFGLLSLPKINDRLRALQQLHALYQSELRAIPGIKFQKIQKGCTPNHQYLPIEIIPESFGLTRDELHLALKADNVVTRKYFYPPAHRYECYKNMEFAQNAILPHTDSLAKRILCLPLYATLTEDVASKICALISAIQSRASEIQTTIKPNFSHV